MFAAEVYVPPTAPGPRLSSGRWGHTHALEALELLDRPQDARVVLMQVQLDIGTRDRSGVGDVGGHRQLSVGPTLVADSCGGERENVVYESP